MYIYIYIHIYIYISAASSDEYAKSMQPGEELRDLGTFRSADAEIITMSFLRAPCYRV